MLWVSLIKDLLQNPYMVPFLQPLARTSQGGPPVKAVRSPIQLFTVMTKGNYNVWHIYHFLTQFLTHIESGGRPVPAALSRSDCLPSSCDFFLACWGGKIDWYGRSAAPTSFSQILCSLEPLASDPDEKGAKGGGGFIKTSDLWKVDEVGAGGGGGVREKGRGAEGQGEREQREGRERGRCFGSLLCIG